ncbi:hypothetical protein PDR5_26210 [Pseudomonas sp. DR 5-09]|nr:hypothetical protein PDR5_26210 [Pseudomonas sp. DR 5-09]
MKQANAMKGVLMKRLKSLKLFFRHDGCWRLSVIHQSLY